MEEAFGLGEGEGGFDGLAVLGVGFAVVAGDDGGGVEAGGVFGTFVAEVFADVDVEEAFEGGEGVVGSLVGFAGLGYFLGGDVGEFADFAHELGGVEEVGELVAPEALAEGVLYVLDAAADEGVAAFHVVVEEGERGAEGEAVEPDADFGEFDGHGVEIDAVDAAFEDAALEQVEVGEFAHVDGDALVLHFELDFAAGLAEFVDDGVPFEGGQEVGHAVGDVVDGFDEEVAAAHSGIEHFEVEEGVVEGFAEFFVGFVFGADVFAPEQL